MMQAGLLSLNRLITRDTSCRSWLPFNRAAIVASIFYSSQIAAAQSESSFFTRLTLVLTGYRFI